MRLFRVPIYRLRHSVCFGVLLWSLLFIGSAWAQTKEYQVEAIVFQQLNGGQVTEKNTYSPPRNNPSTSQTWVLEPLLLTEQAALLNESPDYEVLGHFTWGQEALPSEEAATMHFREPRFYGWIKIYATTLLFANLDLDFEGFRLEEKRRLKLDEVHFFDHPKFGVLLQVSRHAPDEILEEGVINGEPGETNTSQTAIQSGN